MITEVPQSGPAAAQGLRPGDLLVAVGHEAVGGLEEVQQKLAAAKKNGHKNVLVRVERESSSGRRKQRNEKSCSDCGRSAEELHAFRNTIHPALGGGYVRQLVKRE